MVQTGGMDDRRIIDESGIEVYISGDAGDRSLVCILPDSTVCSVKLFVIISIPARIALRKILWQVLCQEVAVAVIHCKIAAFLKPVAKGGYDLCSELRGDRDSVLCRVV